MRRYSATLLLTHFIRRSLFGLVETRGLAAKTRGSGGLLEVTTEGGNHEGTEDKLSATEHGQRKPQKENELEDKVEGEPVDNVDEALSNSEEGKDNPVLFIR